MKHLFLPYELALLAKQKGFEERCVGTYFEKDYVYIDERYANSQKQIKNGRRCLCLAPLYQQIIDWFREEYEIYIRYNVFNYPAAKMGEVFYTWVIDYPNYNKSYWEVLEGGKLPFYDMLKDAIKEAFKLLP